MNLFIKIILTLLISLLGIYPYINGSDEPGALGEIFKYGWIEGMIGMLAFFAAIALYCKSMQTTLELIRPQNRKAKPKAVWQMFIIPYNIIEDFFIMDYISKSIEQEAKSNAKLSTLNDYGFVTGMGWAIAQVMSFIPNEVGLISGVVGMLLWTKHWLFIAKVNRLLLQK